MLTTCGARHGRSTKISLHELTSSLAWNKRSYKYNTQLHKRITIRGVYCKGWQNSGKSEIVKEWEIFTETVGFGLNVEATQKRHSGYFIKKGEYKQGLTWSYVMCISKLATHVLEVRGIQSGRVKRTMDFY